METTNDLIEVSVLREAMRKRPGNYLGDYGRTGCLRLVAAGLDVLHGILSDDVPKNFRSHAFLDIAINGNNVETLIDFASDNVWGVEERVAQVEGKFSHLTINPNADLQLGLLLGLTNDLSIFGQIDQNIIPSLGKRITGKEPLSQKGSFLCLTFSFCDALNTSNMTSDFVEGFLAALKPSLARGLVVRNVAISRLE